MSRKIVVSLCAALAVFAFGTMTVGQASGANLVVIQPKESLLAIYGNPPAAGPVGGGLGRNFGFGQNMLFQAGGGRGVALFFEFEVGGKKFKSEACDSFVGGTLMSNNTGENNPLGFSIQFADFQCNKSGEVGKEVLTQSYAGTSDRPWITGICPPAAANCKIDPLKVGGLVKIEDVSINIGPGLVVQGTVWGEWINGGKGKAPCIKLKANAGEPIQNLIITQSAALPVGTAIKTVGGEACLISSNNDWYNQSGEVTEPTIELRNE